MMKPWELLPAAFLYPKFTPIFPPVKRVYPDFAPDKDRTRQI